MTHLALSSMLNHALSDRAPYSVQNSSASEAYRPPAGPTIPARC